MTYITILHHNSNRSRFTNDAIDCRRKGLPHITRQIVRAGPEGKALEHAPSRDVLRAFRSKYEPHVGAKEYAKACRPKLS